jgi:hypothetical protein
MKGSNLVAPGYPRYLLAPARITAEALPAIREFAGSLCVNPQLPA